MPALFGGGLFKETVSQIVVIDSLHYSSVNNFRQEVCIRFSQVPEVVSELELSGVGEGLMLPVQGCFK